MGSPASDKKTDAQRAAEGLQESQTNLNPGNTEDAEQTCSDTNAETAPELQDKLPLELQFKNEDEKRSGSLTDLGCDKMDYQEVDLNCREDYIGKEVESGASMDLLMNQEAREEWLKREGLTDFIFGGMDDMNSRQETDNQHIDLVSNQENGEKKFSLDGSGEEGEHVIGEKINISEDQRATEMDHRESELRLKQCEKEDVMKRLANEEVRESKNGDFLDKREKELHDIQNSPNKAEMKGHSEYVLKKQEAVQDTTIPEGSSLIIPGGNQTVAEGGQTDARAFDRLIQVLSKRSSVTQLTYTDLQLVLGSRWAAVVIMCCCYILNAVISDQFRNLWGNRSRIAGDAVLSLIMQLLTCVVILLVLLGLSRF